MAMSTLIHRALNALGVEVRLVRNLRAARIARQRDHELDAWRGMASRRFGTILDIGANEGQFAAMARSLWPQATIHSFEPIPAVHAVLAARFADDPAVVTHAIGLSDQAGTSIIHCSEFSPSSSLLPMGQLHREEWPQSAAHTDVEVCLRRLDDLALAPLASGPLLVKIDVQGFEAQVIAGGEATLRRASHVVLEVSFHELYEGQPLFADIHDQLRALGFAYRGNIEQFQSKDKTRVLFADAIFENLNPVESDA